MTTQVVRPFRGVSADERRQQRRAALLEAGLSVIAEAGMAATTIEAVSARAGLSKRYFYEHFRSRDELFAVLADGLIDQILRGAVESIRAHRDLDARMRAGSSWVASFLADDARRARLFVDVVGNGSLHSAVGSAEHTLARLIVDEITAGTEVSTGQRARHYAVTVIIVTGTAQIVTDWLDGRCELSLEDLVDTVANMSSAAIRTVQPGL